MSHITQPDAPTAAQTLDVFLEQEHEHEHEVGFGDQVMYDFGLDAS